MRRGLALLGSWGVLSCAAPAAKPRSEPAPPAASAAPSPPSPEDKALPETQTDLPVSVEAVKEDTTPFTRVLEAPVRAIAIDKEPHVAALGDDVVHVHDRKGWRQEALPAPALSSATLELFYGRDYRVRLVGTRQGEGGLETLYYRWLPGGFRAAPDELGRLGATRRGGLVALLGTADPEVVCRPGDVCLIKRLSGWASIAAPPQLELVAIHAGRAWAVAGSALLTVEDDKRWKVLSDRGPWAKASALGVTTNGVWVVESEAGQLHLFEQGTFVSSPSPSARPRVVWSAGDEAWLGGEEGLFRRRGSDWHKVVALSGSVSAIVGRDAEDVWVGGSAGLFRRAAAK